MLSHYFNTNATRKILQILKEFDVFIDLIKLNEFWENNSKLLTIFSNIIRLLS